MIRVPCLLSVYLGTVEASPPLASSIAMQSSRPTPVLQLLLLLHSYEPSIFDRITSPFEPKRISEVTTASLYNTQRRRTLSERRPIDTSHMTLNCLSTMKSGYAELQTHPATTLNFNTDNTIAYPIARAILETEYIISLIIKLIKCNICPIARATSE